MRKQLLIPFFLTLALFAGALQSCGDDLDNVNPSDWPMSESQTVNGVTFTLSPCALEDDEPEDGLFSFVPCNDFPEGDYVWFALDISNGGNVPVCIKRQEDGKQGLNGCISIYNQYGAFVTALMTDPEDGEAANALSLQPGKQSEGLLLGINRHCWPADLMSGLIKYKYWKDKPLAEEGLYRALLKTVLPVYKCDGAACGEKLFDAELQLAVSFVIR